MSSDIVVENGLKSLTTGRDTKNLNGRGVNVIG